MLICVPINVQQQEELVEKVIAAQDKADLIEIWFDEIEELEIFLQNLPAINKLPILYKTTKISSDRIDQILKIGIAYIDFDLSVDESIIKEIRINHPHLQIIISYHNFSCTPPDPQLSQTISEMKKLQPNIIKLATTACALSDSIRMLNLLDSHTQAGDKMICIAMGKEGEITRTTGHLFGNQLMFAPLKDEEKTAPGQLTVTELKNIINLIHQ